MMIKRHCLLVALIFGTCPLGAFASPAKACHVSNPSKYAASEGFSGRLGKRVNWTRLDKIVVSGHVICPYIYHFVWGQSGRATTRLVLFSSSYKYLGSYVLTAPRKVFSKGNELTVINMGGGTDHVVFNDALPPKKIFIDGDVLQLFK